MIEHRCVTASGVVRAGFIGSDAEFQGETFGDQYEKIVASRSEILALAYTEQVHGDHVFAVEAETAGIRYVGEGDALVTHAKNTALLIRTADCIPILFYSKSERVVGAVHAGWRGLEQKILTKTLQTLGKSPYPDLEFVVGPFIREMSYEVGADVAGRFSSACSEAKPGGKYMLNLMAILGQEFAALGIGAPQIIWHAIDTLTAHDWYSARRGQSKRNLAFIYSC